MVVQAPAPYSSSQARPQARARRKPVMYRPRPQPLSVDPAHRRALPHWPGGWALLLALSGLGLSPSLGAQTPPSPSERSAYTGLLAAADQGDLPTLTRLLSTTAPPATLAQRDGLGRTAVHLAAHAGHHAALRQLAHAGADLNALDHEAYDAVTIAAVANDEATLALLLQLGASAQQITSPYRGTALIAAAHLGHAGVVRQLIAAGAPLDHVNRLHWTATIEAVVLGDGGPRHQATLAALVQAGARLDLTDREGRTPLQLARSRGYTEMVRLLEVAPTPR